MKTIILAILFLLQSISSSIATKKLSEAIHWLAPHLPKETAKEYADIIQHQSRRRGIDPLLVSAFIQVETARQWDPELISPTYDFGLMQIHVSQHSYPEFRGREWILFIPVRNIRAGVNLMAIWRSHHKNNCQKHTHHYINHMKWGYKVRGTEHAEKVLKIYDRLRAFVRSEPSS